MQRPTRTEARTPPPSSPVTLRPSLVAHQSAADVAALGATVLELVLGRPDLCVWLARIDRNLPPSSSAEGLLTRDEEDRARRFRFPGDRHAFVVRRALLRVLIGLYVDTPPDRLRFAARRFGKPVLVFPNIPLDFSASHSGDAVAVALAVGSDVGVDVERFDAMQEIESLVAVALAPPEATELAGLSAEERPRAFLEWWTAKEALLKADGVGLSVPPAEIAIERWPELRLARPHARIGGPWRLERVPLPDDLVGAVATRECRTSKTERQP